jgi:hypothetical protein
MVQLLQNLSNTIPAKEEPPVRLFQRENNIPGIVPDLLYIYKNENGGYGVVLKILSQAPGGTLSESVQTVSTRS